MTNELFFHKSVLVEEVLTYLDPVPEGIYIDATFGSGGHTKALLKKEPTCTVIGIDWDQISLDTYGPLVTQEFGDRFIPIWGNFAHLYKLIKKLKIPTVNGILADFGTSQMQIKERAGFSFAVDTPLDMRMSSAHQKATAAHVVNTASLEDLIALFKTYGEERYAGKIARAIVEDRGKKSFETTGDLARLIERIIPKKQQTHIHPATRVFQALRIYVNRELEHIKAFLAGAYSLLDKDGRLVCISFHSLEDRLVKNFFREKAHEGGLEIITTRPVEPSEQETEENPSARSAKLRAARRI